MTTWQRRRGGGDGEEEKEEGGEDLSEAREKAPVIQQLRLKPGGEERGEHPERMARAPQLCDVVPRTELIPADFI